MNRSATFDTLDHEAIRAWLKRALTGQETLPRLTSDESPCLGIQRLERELKPAVRDSLRHASRQLVREFCIDGAGEASYLEELIALASFWGDLETVELLAQLAPRFPELPSVPLAVRLAVLAALVDTPPPRDMAFWEALLAQDPGQYAGVALSGLLAINPERAVALLSRLPDQERLGQAAALKLDLAWDNVPPKKRFQLVQDVQSILPSCGKRIAGPVREWVSSKKPATVRAANPSLLDGIQRILGSDSSAQATSPRLSIA